MAIRVGRYALKLPNVRYGWKAMLRGLMHNMDEAGISRWLTGNGRNEPGADRICPVLWSCPGGWLNVMPWCEPVFYGCEQGREEWDGAAWWTEDAAQIAEMTKDDNIGWLGDRLVTFDYVGP